MLQFKIKALTGFERRVEIVAAVINLDGEKGFCVFV